MANDKGDRESFGSIRLRPSRSTKAQTSAAKKRPGRFDARYTGPDGKVHSARTAGGRASFEKKEDAKAALRKVQVAIEAGTWTAPDAAPPPPPVVVLFGAYAAAWIASADLAVRTREEYEKLLRNHLEATFGQVELSAITPAEVRAWHAKLDASKPTARAHAYGLLRTVLGVAVADDVIPTNPCRVKGAGQVKRARKIRPATLAELAAVAKAMGRCHLMVLLAAWCALRFGEITELRRGDVVIVEKDGVKSGVLRVSRGVVLTKAVGPLVKDPKTDAGTRDVAIPPHLLPVLEDHLRDNVGRAKTCLLFPSAADPGKHLTHSVLNKAWLKARVEAGRPDLAFHDLRHTGATLAAATGATIAELMARVGHSTPAAAMRYQHAAANRDQVIAEALSGLAEA